MKRRGFTLIEMLVVISIIGILASIVAVSAGNSKMRSRDARRKADLKQMTTALEQYAVTNGKYPSWTTWNSDPESPTAPSIVAACNSGSATDIFWSKTKGWTNLSNELEVYVTTLPLDPTGNCATGSLMNKKVNNSYPNYTYFSNYPGMHYSFVILLENDKDTETNSSGTAAQWTADQAQNGKYKNIYYYPIFTNKNNDIPEYRARMMATNGSINQ